MQQLIPATKQQKQLLHIVVPKSILEECVQWATNDNNKRSCNDLTFEEANKILPRFGKEPHKLRFWAKFNKDNTRHMYILSLCIQYGWVVMKRGRRFADLDKLNEFLHGNSPVKKALEDMQTDELTKVIGALCSMMLKKNEKPIKLE